MLDDEEKYEENITALVSAIKSAIKEKEEQKAESNKPKLTRQKSSLQRFNKKAKRVSAFTEKMEKANENLSEDRMMKFWERNFKTETVLEWDRYLTIGVKRKNWGGGGITRDIVAH